MTKGIAGIEECLNGDYGPTVDLEYSKGVIAITLQN